MDFPKSVEGVGLVGGRFIDENPVSGQQGSLIVSKWGNQVTDEIINVLNEAKKIADDPSSFEPNEDKSDQLANAIKTIIEKAIDGIGNSWSNLEEKPNSITSLTNVITVSSTTSLNDGQLGFVLINAGTGNVTITLPAASNGNKASQIVLLRIDNSSNTVSIKAATGQTINYNTDLNLKGQGDFIHLFSDTVGWYSLTPSASENQKGLVRLSPLPDVIAGTGDDVVTATTFINALNSRATVIYPNGTEASPFTITRNQRIVIPNDFNTMNLLVIPEVKSSASSSWGSVEWTYASSTSNGVSAKCLSDGTIVITSGTGYIYNTRGYDGNPFEDTAVQSASLRLRIIVLGA